MESELTPGLPPTAAEAAELLSAVDEAGAAIAGRLVTPWWYHPVYALLTGLIVASTGLPHAWTPAAMGVGGLGLAVLLGVYRNLTGLGVVTGGGLRVLRWMWLVLAAAVVAVAVILVAHRPLVTAAATLAFMPVAVLAGRRVDDALRDSLRPARGGSR